MQFVLMSVCVCQGRLSGGGNITERRKPCVFVQGSCVCVLCMLV